MTISHLYIYFVLKINCCIFWQYVIFSKRPTIVSSSGAPRIITLRAWSLFLAFFFPLSEFTSLPISMNLYHFPKLLLCSFVVDMCSLFFFFNPPLVIVLVTKSCPTLCDCVGCSPLVSSVHAISPGKNPGVGYQFLLQGTFLPKESNPHLLHCRRIHYHWETQKSSRYFLFGNCPSPAPSTWFGEAIRSSLPFWWQEWPRDRLSNQILQPFGNYD